jgi:chromosome segregation ATPase
VFICEDNDTAKKISHGQRAFACVTLMGDSYRTDGVIGGGANTLGNRLQQIQQYMEGEKDVRKNS